MKTGPSRRRRGAPARGARPGDRGGLPALQGGGVRRRQARPTSMWRGMYWSILLMVAMPFAMVGTMIVAVSRARRRKEAGPAAAGRAAALPGLERSAFLRRAAALTALAALLAVALRAEKPAPISKLAPSAELDRFLARVAAETVAEFAQAGLTAEGISIAVIDLSPAPAASALPSGALPRRRELLPVLGREALLPLLLRVAEGGRQALGQPRARARRQGHDHASPRTTRPGSSSTRSPGRRRAPRSPTPPSGRSGRRGATSSTTSTAARGYTNLNANQKTFCEDAYGREQAFRDDGKNRNRMSATEAARIFKEIVRGEVAGPTLDRGDAGAALARHRAAEKPSRTWSPRTRAWRGRGFRRAAASGRSPATRTTSITSSAASSCRTARSSSSPSSRRA